MSASETFLFTTVTTAIFLTLLASVAGMILACANSLAHDVFAQAFINAMRPSLAVAIAVLLVGALLTTAITGRRKQSAQRMREAAPAVG